VSAILATATDAPVGVTVVAEVNGTATVVQIARDLTVASGDVLIVERIGSQWFAIGRAWAAAPAATNPQPPPEPKPTVTTGSLVVSPVETRSYRASYGWRTDNTDMYQGQYGGWGNHTGCAFYGSKPRSLAGATVTDARIRVRRLTAGTYAAQATTMRLVTQSSLAVGATNNSFDVPSSWVQAMVDGTAGGLAIYDADGSPYVRLAGRGSWSPAWTLTITWRR